MNKNQMARCSGSEDSDRAFAAWPEIGGHFLEFYRSLIEERVTCAA